MHEREDHTDYTKLSKKSGLIRYGQKSTVDAQSNSSSGKPRTKTPPFKELGCTESGFTHLRDGGAFADALIHVGPVTFPVHRNILACSSPYFRALFTNLHKTTGKKNRVHDARDDNFQTLPSPEAMTRQTIEAWLSSPNREYKISSPSASHQENNNDIQLEDVEDTYEQNYDRSRSTCNNLMKQPTTRSLVPPTLHDPDSRTNRQPYSLSNSHERAMYPRGAFAEQSRSAFSQHSSRRGRSSPRYEVSLQDIAPDTADTLIEHAYGGSINVTPDNVEQLLTAADRFQVSSLLNECCSFLLNELTITNCISIIKFSSRFYACDSLRKLATRFLLDNFPTVFQTSSEFEQLTKQELTAILRADQLNVKHEETVLDAIIRWVLADVTDRHENIPDLVQCVRVGLMLPENMREFVDSWLVSSNLSSEFNHVTLQVMEAVLQCQKQQMTVVDGAMFSPRLPRDILFVIGGSNFGFPLNLVEAFDCRTFGWSVICPYDFAPRSYHGMVSLGKDIYVIGGFSGHVYLSSCCKLRVDSLTWENVTPMNTKRCYVGAVTLNGYIYTVGGYDGIYRLNSAERFSTETNQWSFIAPMLQQRSDAGVAVLDDKVYVCGGFNGMECIRSVELYDPELDQWSTVPSMPRGRSGLGLAAHNGRLYAVGGFDGVDSSVRLSVMECYNPETCQWTELEPMFHPRSNLAVEILEDIMYAIGGYCGDRTTSIVECYDFDTNTWFKSGQLSHNRSALGACVVSGLPNTSEILQRNGPERCALVHCKD